MQLLLTLALNDNIINIIFYDVTIWIETLFEPILRKSLKRVQLIWMQKTFYLLVDWSFD
jgi:hypothetical protein